MKAADHPGTNPPRGGTCRCVVAERGEDCRLQPPRRPQFCAAYNAPLISAAAATLSQCVPTQKELSASAPLKQKAKGLSARAKDVARSAGRSLGLVSKAALATVMLGA